jgi:alkylation response protein AidB-like acyl-CoA dehydrogenase
MFVALEARKGTEWIEHTVEELRTFADANRPELRRLEREGSFPRGIYEAMGKRGWIGPTTSTDLGGLGGGIAEYCVICEEVARHGLVSPQISIQGQRWLNDWGTDDQRKRYLSGIAQGKLIFSESISEPDAASSLRALRATASRDDGGWVIDGKKTHVNLGHQSDVTLVYANAERHGLTAFLVDTDTAGVSSRQTAPIGLRLLPTAEMTFDSVRVSDAAVLGAPGRGLDTFLSTFNVSRLGNASELIGYGRRALADAIRYAANRPVGDSVVTDFQGIQWTVAEAYDRLYAASLARDHAANLADSGTDPSLATTIAKALSVSAAEYAVNEAFALVGSHGLYGDTDFGQLMHDVKVYRIAGGSLEVLRNYVARRVLHSDRLEGID